MGVQQKRNGGYWMTGSWESKIIIVLFVFMSLHACQLEYTNYPTEPYIEFREISYKDSFDLLGNASRKIFIHYYLVDGDGDIGPIYNNDFSGWNTNIELYVRNQNNYFIDTSMVDSLRWVTVPFVGDLGQDYSLKADIYLDFEYNTEPEKSYTNFYYSITMYDLNLHKSNTIYTDTIIIDK